MHISPSLRQPRKHTKQRFDDASGTIFANSNFDNHFYDRVTARVYFCTDDPSGFLNEPLKQEVSKVCSRLKRGISGVLIHVHVLFTGPPLWKHLFCFLLGGVSPSDVACPAFLFLTTEIC